MNLFARGKGMWGFIIMALVLLVGVWQQDNIKKMVSNVPVLKDWLK